ncbi:MAG TPA: ATP-binding protein, partial [Candidatus Acidoferrum sp.]
HATLLSTQGLPLPAAIREVQKKEGIESAYVVVLWSNEKIIGGLIVASRTVRELASADKSLLIAVGSQIAGAVERGALYEETRQAYENLRRTQEQLLHSEKLAAVGQLISGVAHELNNPLTAILGYSQLLTSSAEVGPQALGYAEKLYKQTQRTQRIVQNLLSFARQHKPERVPVRLNSVIEDTLALRDYDLRNGRIRVHLDLSPALPQTAADPHQLQQVFLNLINNAVDAILEKSDEGDLYVRTGAEGCQIFVEFTDSGPGVKDASRVFDPFYTTKPVGKGTGLGLSICYGIITEHGGTIVVRNGPSGGATFRVELPLQSKSEVRPGTEPAQSKAARSGRVLVVDASESVLDTVAKLLRSGNHLVETATSLAEARKRLAGGEFDLVVADRELVVNLDAEVHGAGKSAASHGLGPNVLWTSSQTPGNGRVCREGTILQKPLRADDLLAAVDARLQSLAAPTLQG